MHDNYRKKTYVTLIYKYNDDREKNMRKYYIYYKIEKKQYFKTVLNNL
jgi:hypothetical protein